MHCISCVSSVLVKPTREFVVSISQDEQITANVILGVGQNLVEKCRLRPHHIHQMLWTHEVVSPDVLI
ncbi:hypothetical protein C6W10_18015 [Plantactinospora sp. BB1]|nr:hypothetical protein C6W10_18015 [Plantactinospora sp. BB1]